MKKTFLSIAIVIGSLMASTATFAQTPGQTPDAKTRTEAPARGNRQVYNPFEGLNLSEQQLADLKALANAKQEKMKKMREEARNSKGENKGEAIADPKARAEAQLQERKEDLAKIKAILTPEQYVQYLENAYLNLGNRDMQANRDMRQGGRNTRGGDRRGGERRGGGERMGGQNQNM